MSCYIIAEAGVNHNGSFENAKRLIEVAKESGADAIKFQTFVSEQIVSYDAAKAEYQIKLTDKNESQFEMLKRLELSFDEFKRLKEYCDKIEIEFLSSAFDLQSVDFLHEIGMERWKIPSGEITNRPYLEKIAKMRQPVILSTGMSTIEEISEALTIFEEFKSNQITLLHCTTEYPTPLDEVNLKAMELLFEEFNYPIGYSDHTMGILVPIGAVALGATVIEKHFTLDKTMEGPDHKASLEPHELKEMVNQIRNIEKALGIKIKEPSYSELKNKLVARKSIVASTNINVGDVFSIQNITVKRPGTGISPMRWYDVLGQKAKRSYRKDELIIIE